MTEGMDLFENSYNKTPKYIVLAEPTECTPAVDATKVFIDLTNDDFEDLSHVTEDILPQSAIECAHLDVYDASGTDHQVVPYRLTSPAFPVDSDAYHR